MFKILTNQNIRDSIILVLLFFFTEFLGWKYVGPISIRNIGVVFMILYLVCTRESHIFSNYNLNAVKILAFYYVFVSVLGLVNDLYSNSGFTIVFARFLPSLIVFYFLLSFIDNSSKLKNVIIGLLIILVLDAAATILQGINHPIGWLIAQYFKDFESVQYEMDLMQVHNTSSTIGLSIASGFYGTVVGNGYFLGTFGMLFIMPVIWKPSKLSAVLSFLIFSLCLTALFYCQQRMAFYIYLLGSVSIFLYYCILTRKYILIVLATVVACFALAVGAIDMISGIDAGRLMNLEDDAREAKHALFWEYFFPSNFLLGNRTLFINLYQQTPHSMFIETSLLGGIFGLMIFICFLIQLFKLIFQYAFKRYYCDITMLSTPVIAFLGISLQHSSGLHTGMTLGVYALGLFYLSTNLCKNNENSVTY